MVLVIFDEAHKLSCDQGGDFRVTKSDRYRLAEMLAGASDGAPAAWGLPWKAEHLLLLTATPHMGKDYPYFGLWRLLNPQCFSTWQAFEGIPPEVRTGHFLRRTKEEMVHLDGTPLYPMRVYAQEKLKSFPMRHSVWRWPSPPTRKAPAPFCGRNAASWPCGKLTPFAPKFRNGNNI
ncbi:MAG: hypothetical protein LBO64_05330 [Desulfovibrio sp.]|jgi:hypothetical protein|nr:hypothetical protein [Desulfovibrio sp.]